MSSATRISVDPLVGEIANSFAILEGHARMTDDVLHTHALSVSALQGSRREEVGAELAALSSRLANSPEGHEGWLEAIIQLSFLVAVSLGNVVAAVRALEETRLASRARLLVGAVTSKLPIGGPRPEGTASPFHAMLASRQTHRNEG